MPCMREHRKTTAANLPSDCTQVGTGQLQAKNQQEAKGKIELRNTKTGVLQVLFGMLQLVDSLFFSLENKASREIKCGLMLAYLKINF